MTEWPERLNVDRFLLRDRLDEGHGERVALRLDGGPLTYSAVDSAASAIAGLLLEAGLQRSDRGLVVLPDGLAFVASLFGLFRVGAVAIMINPGLTTEAMAAVLGQARASVALVHPDHLDVFESAREKVGSDTLGTGARRRHHPQ